MDPTPEQDLRFGDPTSPSTPWGDVVRTIETAELFWISTVRSDGRPHVTPLTAVWSDSRLHFCTGPSEQKALNMAANPLVALTSGANDWKDGLDVVVEGAVTRVTDATSLAVLADQWRAKYRGEWDFAVRDGSLHHPDGVSRSCSPSPRPRCWRSQRGPTPRPAIGSRLDEVRSGSVQAVLQVVE